MTEKQKLFLQVLSQTGDREKAAKAAGYPGLDGGKWAAKALAQQDKQRSKASPLTPERLLALVQKMLMEDALSPSERFRAIELAQKIQRLQPGEKEEIKKVSLVFEGELEEWSR